MRFLPYVAGYILWDKERSDQIRSQLIMRKWNKQTHERKRNWLEHLQRMSSEGARQRLGSEKFPLPLLGNGSVETLPL
jgi:hypothetical protein